MNESAWSPLGALALTATLDASPEGVAVFDDEWTIRYVNPAAAALWKRPVAELVHRNLWMALPELGGTILHSFLLHARNAGTPVTWQGFYAPAGCWLSATAVDADGLLQLYVHPAGGGHPERPADADIEPAVTQDDADRLRFLAEVSEALIATLDTGETSATLAELVVPRLGDGAIVTVLADDGQTRQESHTHRDPVRRAAFDTYLAGRLRGTGDDTPMIQALLSGEPVQLAAIDQAAIAPSLPTEEVRAAWRDLDASSFTIVPLRARGETFGVLTLLIGGGRSPHTEMEIATAVEVARRGALALDNARLYGRQLKVAETLQRSLLTPPSEPDHLEIAVRYRPAAAYQQVGGDWYDAFTGPDGATVMVIGDVVGHDIDAAAAMGQFRSLLRRLACDRPGSPAQTLSRVDRVLATLGVDTMATALVARIEQSPAQATRGLRTLRWSSAGHLPPLLLAPDGEARSLDTPADRLLGAGADGFRADHDVEIHPGETVVLYTDGLVEHGRTGIDEGMDRLTTSLAGLAGLPVQELCDRLLTGIVTGRADDDIALLAVRFHPEDDGDRR